MLLERLLEVLTTGGAQWDFTTGMFPFTCLMERVYNSQETQKQKKQELRIILASEILNFPQPFLWKDSSILFPLKPYININTNIYGTRWCLVIWAARENDCLASWAPRHKAPLLQSGCSPQPIFPVLPVTGNGFLQWCCWSPLAPAQESWLLKV